MSEQIRERLNDVFNLILCPVAGCWPLHGAELEYYYDRGNECHTLEAWPVGIEESVVEGAGTHNDNASPLLYEMAEFDFTELPRAVPLEHFHFSQQQAVFVIGWKEFGKDLEIERILFQGKLTSAMTGEVELAGNYSDRVARWFEVAGILGAVGSIAGVIAALVIGSEPLLFTAFGLMGVAGLMPSIYDMIESRKSGPVVTATRRTPPVRYADIDNATQGKEIGPDTDEWRFQERFLGDRDSRGHTLH